MLPYERRQREDQQRIGLHVEPRAELARFAAAARERAVDAVERCRDDAQRNQHPAERAADGDAERSEQQQHEHGAGERHGIGGTEGRRGEAPRGEPQQQTAAAERERGGSPRQRIIVEPAAEQQPAGDGGGRAEQHGRRGPARPTLRR